MKKGLVRLSVAMGVVMIAMIGLQAMQPDVMAAPAEKVLICHRAPDGTHYVLIETKELSPFGALGHYDAGGDPEPGHEGDVLPDENGDCPCLGEENVRRGK